MVLGIAAQVWEAQRGTRCPSLWWQGGSETPSPAARPAGWAPKQGLLLLVSVQGRAGGAGWLETLGFCCITLLEKLLLVGKIQRANKWYLSVPHVCGGVKESQQPSFLVAPSAIPPQIIQENLQKTHRNVKKVLPPFRKQEKARKGFDRVQQQLRPVEGSFTRTGTVSWALRGVCLASCGSW